MTRTRLPALKPWSVSTAALVLPFALPFALLLAPATQAQDVALSGEYSDVSGVIVHLPQNPGTEYTCSNAQDARCINRNQGFFGQPQPAQRTRAATGVTAGPRILPSLAAATNGLAVGDAFRVPPLMMTQNAALTQTRSRPVLNNAVAEIDTNVAFGLPNTARSRFPDTAQTRVLALRNFSPANPLAAGQHNGVPITSPGYRFRQGVNTTVSQTAASGAEFLRLRYSGGLGFSGTMEALLAGEVSFYVTGPAADNALPSSLHPGVIRARAGDVGPSPALRVQHGAGWDYEVQVTQPTGTFKAFPSVPSVVGVPCAATPPPSPAGCNDVDAAAFDSFGIDIGPVSAATSTRHLFAWTTGTVSIVRTAIRNGITSTQTVTAMGYDTTSPTSMGGTIRRVGLVAGSFTERNPTARPTELGPSIVGVNFELVPEPGSTVALIGGLGLLAGLAHRRR